MEYSTYIFEESKKKLKANRIYTLAIIGAVILGMPLYF